MTEGFARRPKWQQYAILAVMFLIAFGILLIPSKPSPERRKRPDPAAEGALPAAPPQQESPPSVDGSQKETERPDEPPRKAEP